jgi:hypothetical protein
MQNAQEHGMRINSGLMQLDEVILEFPVAIRDSARVLINELINLYPDAIKGRIGEVNFRYHGNAGYAYAANYEMVLRVADEKLPFIREALIKMAQEIHAIQK